MEINNNPVPLVTVNVESKLNNPPNTIKSEEYGESKEEKPGKDKAAEFYARVKKKLQESNLDIFFEKDIHRYVFQVVEKDTKEVIKSVPPEEIVDILKNINENLGVFLNERS